jgi:two-component system chemotaxis sensor kinase CheA
VIALLLEAVETVRMMIASAKANKQVDVESYAALQKQFENLVYHQGDTAQSEEQDNRKSNESASDICGWLIDFRPHEEMLLTGNDPVRMLATLAELGELKSEVILEGLPDLTDIDPVKSFLGWRLELTSTCTLDEVKEVFAWVEDECDLDIAPLKALETASGVEQIEGTSREIEEDESEEANLSGKELIALERRRKDRRQQPEERRAQPGRRGDDLGQVASTSIRVGTEKIDELINMVGELVITQSMLGMLGESFDVSKLDRLQDGLVDLERHTRQLQESIMRIRMVPINFVFSRFPRMVHDLSVKLGKKVELIVSGEYTELDKTVIEQIGDPLTHLVRNSVDHGIELPKERLKAGKPETGQVFLNAYHKGGSIFIEISDDGAGLNLERIRNKAIGLGLIHEQDEISEQKLQEYIFHPGFSTAAQVTDVSGRGVGMDVVRKNINRLGGNIELKSVQGEGSIFRISLPLTLAILDGQIIRVGDENYIVPIASIIESIQAKKGMVNKISGKGEVFELRDEYVPVLRLYEFFGVESEHAERLEDGLLVVVEGDGRKCGFFVDELLGQQQVVIKSLETNFVRLQGLSGATIFGDGSVALILDVPGMVRLSTEAVEA